VAAAAPGASQRWPSPAAAWPARPKVPA
jgi:hypothetical protein